MGFQEPPVYLLLCDDHGWRSSDKFVSHQQQNVLISRGSFLQVDNYHCFDPHKSVSVTLSVIDKPGARITALIKNLAPITRTQLQLLKNVSSHERRCQLVMDGHLDINVGDTVMYSPPKDPGHVLARVKYVGRVQEMARDGFLLGLEVIEPGWCQGGLGRDYFGCEAGRGVFCDIGMVTPVRGNVGRIASMMENNNNNPTVLNITLSEKRNNMKHPPSSQTSSNNLKMIHNDLKNLYISQNTESETETKAHKSPLLSAPGPSYQPSPSPEVIRPTLATRTRKDSDHFSWDPNSKRSGSRTSTNKKSSVNGGLRNGRPSPPHSTTSSNYSNGTAPVKNSGSIYYNDQRFQGCDSDGDTPPPPPHRDSFVTPSEETGPGLSWSQVVTNTGPEPELTWSQRLSSSKPKPEFVQADLSDQSGDDNNSRSHRSPTPPVEFVEPYLVDEKDLQSVAVGSMVQLETDTGDKMCGVVRYCGDFPGRPGHWVGVEMEEEIRGGGNGWVQNHQLFNCAPSKGVFVPYTHVIPDPRFKESLPPPSYGQDFGPMESPVVPGFCPPHSTVENVISIGGRNKGIQGHQNSCYLDATLFSMFTFTSVFDSLLYRPRAASDISRYDEVQTCLKEEIVNPLRKSLFVRADRVMKLRTLLDSLSDVKGLTDQEKDPEEFLSSLLTQVMKVEPFLELSSGQTAHHYQLIVEKDPNIIVPTVQDLFDQSFATGTGTSRVKLRRAPSVLILQMPRFGRQFKLYDRILPSQLLDVTDVIVSSPRQCVICGVLAEYECSACYGSHLSGMASTAYCAQCLQRTHQHKQRRNHKQEKLEKPPGWVKQPQQPIPRIYMELIAVVCIETSHYVSFVRCGDTPQAPWCFFDSMADRKGEQNGYNIPELTPASELEKIMSETFAEELRGNPSMPLGDQAKRLVSDAYMCFYQSPDVKMYR